MKRGGEPGYRRGSELCVADAVAGISLLDAHPPSEIKLIACKFRGRVKAEGPGHLGLEMRRFGDRLIDANQAGPQACRRIEPTRHPQSRNMAF